MDRAPKNLFRFFSAGGLVFQWVERKRLSTGNGDVAGSSPAPHPMRVVCQGLPSYRQLTSKVKTPWL